MNQWMRLTRLMAPCALVMSCGTELLTPEIVDFSPKLGTPGTTVVITGHNFDRDGAGYPLPAGAVDWQVYLISAGRRYLLSIEDLTPDQLVVVVPDGAASGKIAIADANGFVMESSARFEMFDFPIVRVVNEAQYDAVDLRFNGQQVLTDGKVLESGAIMDVSVDLDRYRVEYGVGDARSPWVRGVLRGVEVAELGSVVVVRIPPLSTTDVLTVSGAATDWVAELHTQGTATTATLRVYGDGAWALFEGITPRQSGQLVGDFIAPYASNAPFQLVEGGPVARFAPPFASFDLENGPEDWPVLRYVRAP